MCNLLRVATKEKIKGYKIVAKKLKGKRYFSIAIGFKYPLDGHIPIARKQQRISLRFVKDIISKDSALHKEDMVGRTTIYLDASDAYQEIQHLRSRGIKAGYRLVIVWAEVSIDLMEGTYGSSDSVDRDVVAGRHIRFIEEMPHYK